MIGGLRMNLFIIGNGFDLAHNLPTAYMDFRKFVFEELDGRTFIDSFERLSSYDSVKELWSDFENNLGELSVEYIIDEGDQRRLEFNAEFDYEPLDDGHITDFLSDEYFSFFKEINEDIKVWAESINVGRCIQFKGYDSLFNNECRFISFNYTKTLEDVYEVDDCKVFHIHGVVDEEPVIGHGKSSIEFKKTSNRSFDFQTLEFRENMQRDFAKFFKSMKKDVPRFIEELDNFIDEISEEISDIYVIGHSMGEVDLPYFFELKSLNPEANWHISFFDAADYERKKYCIEELNLSNVELIESKLLNNK